MSLCKCRYRPWVYGTVYLLLITTMVNMVSADDFYELLGIGREASPKEIRQAFKKKALSMHPDKNTDDPDAHSKFLRINRAYEVLKDEELRKKYDTHGEEGLKEDSPSGGGYRSWNFYQQQFGLYDDDPNIITLSRSDFEASVENTQDAWFINYYSPHCGHCHDMAPTWKKIASDLEGVIRIGAVNCEDDWMLCRQQGIHGYPSLIIYPSREKYNGERSHRDLVRHVLRSVKAKAVDLWEGNFEEIMNEQVNKPWLISFCGNKGDCMQKLSVKKIAAMLADLVSVGEIDCNNNEKLCSKLGIEFGTHYFESSVKEGQGVKIDSLDAKEVASAVLSRLPDVQELGASELQAAIIDLKNNIGGPWLIHFVEGEYADLELRKLPALLLGANVGRVDCKLARMDCNILHIHKFPTFVLFKLGGGFEIHHGRLTAHDVAAFAKDSAQTSVVVLGPHDFPGRVIEGKESWFVDFYAPWCPPCMRLLPEFRKASKQVSHFIRFGTVDCTIHTNLCHHYNVRSYPTTIFYNQSVPHQFHGHHSANAIIEFIYDTLNPPVMPLDHDKFQEVVGEKSPQQMVLVDFFAPWCGPCQQLAPEWRRFAKMFNNNPDVKVTHVDCQTYDDLCRMEGVNAYPTIRLYPMGSYGKSQWRKYDGWFRDAHSLRVWAYSFLPSKTVLLHNNNFNELVLNSEDPWIVDFYAPWCGHCQTFAPEFERVATVMEGRVKAGKVDCDQNQVLCRNAGIQAYPSVRYYPGTSDPNYQTNYFGQDLNSQNGDYIISFLDQQASQKRQGRINDEL